MSATRPPAAIEELVLRLPGLPRADVAPLVAAIVERVRRGLPASYQPIDLPELTVRLAVPRGLARDALAERIARALLDQLRPGGAT